MTKTKRMLVSQLALVDVVIELLDARIPLSSRNPDLEKLAAGKHRIMVMAKTDLASPTATAEWESHYRLLGYPVLVLDARKKGEAVKAMDIARACMQEKTERLRKRGRIATDIRALVVGIPNVGKSTFINALCGRTVAAAADKPGVTRGRKWVKICPGFEMLDTPGVLWPKFEDPMVGLRLAVTGAVSDEVVDKVTLCGELLSMLCAITPQAIEKRYKVKPEDNENPLVLLDRIGHARGFKLKGDKVDTERAAIMVLDEFRGGKLGRITLERPLTGY
jgi:ribosome biogenesis GTPase A